MAVTPTGYIHNPIFPTDKYPYGLPQGDSQGGANVVGIVMRSLISVFLTVAVVAFVLYFLLGGIHWITSRGDESKVKEAQQRITNAVIGLSVVFLLFVFLKLLGTIFDVEALRTLQLMIPRLVP